MFTGPSASLPALHASWPAVPILMQPLSSMTSPGCTTPAAHGGQRRDRLEGRPRRIGAADRAVEERRAAAVAEQAIGRGLRERLGEDRRVDGRIGAERQHAAVARVERDEAAGGAGALVDRLVEVLLAGLLQPDVERRAHRAPGYRVVPRRRALGPPERVDGDLGRAVDAAQVLVVGALEPALADHRPLRDALEALELELLVVDLADAAHELRRQGVLGVAAQELALDVDAGEALGVLDEVVAARDVDVDLDRHVGVGQRRQRLHHALLDRLGRHVQHAREALEAGLEVRRGRRRDGDQRALPALGPARAGGHVLAPRRRGVALGGGQALGIDLHHRRRAVLHQHVAVAIDDVAARRLHAHLAHAVVARLLEVLVAGEHLQVPQAEEDDREEHEGDAAQDRHAQRELRGDRRAALVDGDGIDHARESGERPPVV